MPTKAEVERYQQEVEVAKGRVLVVLREHSGFFPYTSELASCVGLRRNVVRTALENLESEGVLRQVDCQEELTGYGAIRCKAYELVDQTPSPLLRLATIRSHFYSQTTNEHGADSHPWRNATLTCISCAKVRECLPDWRVACNGEATEAYRPAHVVQRDTVQLPLSRRS